MAREEGTEELYLNMVDSVVGTSLFSYDFRNPEATQVHEDSQLEAGLVKALSEFAKSLDNQRITLIRHKRIFKTGQKMYMDNRVSYGEKTIGIMHFSTGKTSPQPTPQGISYAFEQLLPNTVNYKGVVRRLSLSEPDISSFMAINPRDAQVVYQEGCDPKTLELEPSMLLAVSQYTDALASSKRDVVRDSPVLLRSETPAKIAGTYNIKNRYISRRGELMFVVTCDTPHVKHNVVDALISETCDDAVDAFETKYGAFINRGETQECSQFQDFSENMWDAIINRHKKALRVYMNAITDSFAKRGGSPDSVALLNSTIKTNPGMFYLEVDKIYSNPLSKKQIRSAVKAVNYGFEPLVKVFQIGECNL